MFQHVENKYKYATSTARAARFCQALPFMKALGQSQRARHKGGALLTACACDRAGRAVLVGGNGKEVNR